MHSWILFHYPYEVTKIHFIARFDDLQGPQHFLDSEFFWKWKFWLPKISTGNLWQKLNLNISGTRNSNIAFFSWGPRFLNIKHQESKMLSVESKILRKNEDLMRRNMILEFFVPENIRISFCQKFRLKTPGGQNFHFQRNSESEKCWDPSKESTNFAMKWIFVTPYR